MNAFTYAPIAAVARCATAAAGSGDQQRMRGAATR
jgi:hypothetical protein